MDTKKFLTGLYLAIFLLGLTPLFGQNGSLIPTDQSQESFNNAYKTVLKSLFNNYRHTSTEMDSALYPKYGEYSVYWVQSPDNRGSFVYPDELPDEYSNVTTNNYTNFAWQDKNLKALHLDKGKSNVAIFKSEILHNKRSINWQANYFKNVFTSYLSKEIFHVTDEKSIRDNSVSQETELLIIPAFKVREKDQKYFIDSLFTAYPQLATELKTYVENGGMIYTEGNAAYFIEKLGFLEEGTVNYQEMITTGSSNELSLNVKFPGHPASFAATPTNDILYAPQVPKIANPGDLDIIAENADGSHAALFEINTANTGDGKIICNTGLPTVGGFSELSEGSRQLQWFYNTLMYAFSHDLDVTRSVRNNIPDGVTATPNAISYDRVDTFKVRALVRNVSDNNLSNIRVSENIRDYFSFVSVESNQSFTHTDGSLVFEDLTVPSHSADTIIYTLKTPEINDMIHEKVDSFLSKRTYIYPSANQTSYSSNATDYSYTNRQNYADIMFSAFIMADTDVNWKNFLGLEYQPFKVFTMMENKERTSAQNTKYIQYIPKDVPFYWVDHSLNIPVLKTPGGKFVDLMRGSNSQENPKYDYDSDGNPDAWLDTTSIYPKGYTLEEDCVYWANPWAHLKGNDSATVYEDIDRDGKRAKDTDNDGEVEVEEPGDKIRVWKVTWDIGKMAGYEYFEPFCSYELWVDPPKLVELSAGVGAAYDSIDSFPGMYYPNTDNVTNADLSDTSWTYWMERDTSGQVKWKQLILQNINNYEGFTYVDTSEYTLKPSDSLVGTVPQPRREFIAVMSLGGEEIDMEDPLPERSLYSNVEYETIFNEHRTTPIRTTYSYYAPLPNPLQFEYLTNNYHITDTANQDTLKKLPQSGEANLHFNIDASTEYSYYWIRNVGHDVDYNDISQKKDGVESYGDGVFGYMLYEIPKGMGGYSIELPTDKNGDYLIDSLLQIDGGDYEKWIDNPNTQDSVEIVENPFTYEVYIPQILIPAALDDDNYDGVDDWRDDKGDRFSSETGFLNDDFMPGDGSEYSQYPDDAFEGDAPVDSGWYYGSDGTYGDDEFETLGRTNIKINAIYKGEGREGSVDISKGGTMVVEEIFGGSPWVIFSHALSGYAEGVNYDLTSSANPSLIKYPNDTTYIKHTVTDKNEPHKFDIKFAPHHVSYGAGEATATSYAGGQDPCSLIDPAINMSNIMDPDYDHKDNITLIPEAESDLKNYPRDVSGTFFEARIEVQNGTQNNWNDVTVTPQIPDELGDTKVEMAYVAYPRPLVPGDNIGELSAGWRFNQPEGEVLVTLGDTINRIQPTRRAYFVFLIKVDESLDNGVYEIDFTMDGNQEYYDGTSKGKVDYPIAPVFFSIAEKDDNGNVQEFEELVLGQGDLQNITTNTDESYESLMDVKWSLNDVNHTKFDSMDNTLPVSYSQSTGTETIDMHDFTQFPKVDTSKLHILSKGKADSYNSEEIMTISDSETLNYQLPKMGKDSVVADSVTVHPVGPRLVVTKSIVRINGHPVTDSLVFQQDSATLLNVEVEITNKGTDAATNTSFDFSPVMDAGYDFLTDSLPKNTEMKDSVITTNFNLIQPGQSRELHFKYLIEADTANRKSFYTLLKKISAQYEATIDSINGKFHFTDTENLNASLYDFNITSFSASETSDDKVELTIRANNRGKPAEDVWLRVYPLVDSTAYEEIPQVEKKIHYFDNRDEVTITATYEHPDTKKLKLLARIDDGDEFHELIEKNNAMELSVFDYTGVENLANERFNIKISPNPFKDHVLIRYSLPQNIRNVSFKLINSSGEVVMHKNTLPALKGVNSVKINPDTKIKNNAFIYLLEFYNTNGRIKSTSGKLIRK